MSGKYLSAADKIEGDRIRRWPWLAMERRKPTEADAPSPSVLPGRKPKVHVAQLTLTQAQGYDDAAWRCAVNASRATAIRPYTAERQPQSHRAR